MGAQGSAIVDFGAFPGKDQATLAITGQAAILASSLVECWLDPTIVATTDHSQDEHLIAQVEIFAAASAIVAATGFTINLLSSTKRQYGKWNVSWVWN